MLQTSQWERPIFALWRLSASLLVLLSCLVGPLYAQVGWDGTLGKPDKQDWQDFLPKITELTLITKTGKQTFPKLLPAKVHVRFKGVGPSAGGGIPPWKFSETLASRDKITIQIIGIKELQQPLTTKRCEVRYLSGPLTLDIREVRPEWQGKTKASHSRGARR